MPDEFQYNKSSSLTSTNIITEPGMFTKAYFDFLKYKHLIMYIILFYTNTIITNQLL